MTLCSLLRRLLAATALAQAAFSIHAQGFDNVRFDVPTGRGDGIVGAAVINVPRYLGSDERKTRIFPLLDYRWSNGWFAGTGSGVGYNFSTRPSIQYGVRMTADFGRDEDDAAALRGLGDIDPAAEIGAFLNLRLDGGLFLRSALRYGSGNDHDGLVIDAGAGYGWMLAPRWRLGTGVNATYVNQSYMRQYFGVDTTQATRSGYPVYQPGAGVRDVRANVSLGYQISERWGVNASAAIVQLQKDAKASPITRDRTTFIAVLGTAYRF